MPFSPFRLLIYAIIAIALISLIILFVFPLLEEKEDAFKEIETAIEKAEQQEGKAVEQKEILFREGSINTKNFEQKSRLVWFECNSPALCCDKNFECGKGVRWNDRAVFFTQKQKMNVSARCTIEQGLYLCRVYFGTMPAQIEIKELEGLEEKDLSKNQLYEATAKYANIGNIEAFFVKGKAKLYKYAFEENQKKEILIQEKELELNELKAGEAGKASFLFSLSSNGEYKIEARIEAENGGFDIQEMDFNAINSPASACKATQAETTANYNEETKKCEKKYYCTNCNFAFECLAEWNKKMPEKGFELESRNYALEVFEAAEGSCG